ncbi:MAG: hypothetical protein WCQ96_01010 [Patescibacteria group bacterium]
MPEGEEKQQQTGANKTAKTFGSPFGALSGSDNRQPDLSSEDKNKIEAKVSARTLEKKGASKRGGALGETPGGFRANEDLSDKIRTDSARRGNSEKEDGIAQSDTQSNSTNPISEEQYNKNQAEGIMNKPQSVRSVREEMQKRNMQSNPHLFQRRGKNGEVGMGRPVSFSNSKGIGPNAVIGSENRRLPESGTSRTTSGAISGGGAQRAENSTERRRKEMDLKGRKRLAEKFKTRMASLQGGHEEISSFDYFLLFMIFAISVAADILDLVIDLTGVGAFFAPIMSLFTTIILAILWWVVGGEYRAKNLKGLGVATFVEAIPLVDLLPTNTFESVKALMLMISGKKAGKAASNGNSFF